MCTAFYPLILALWVADTKSIVAAAAKKKDNYNDPWAVISTAADQVSDAVVVTTAAK